MSPRPVYPDGEEGVVHHHGEAEDSGQAAHQGQEQYGPEGGEGENIFMHFPVRALPGAKYLFRKQIYFKLWIVTI